MSTTTRQPLADSDEVARYLGVPKRTLDDWAHRGIGPQYSRVGRHRRYDWPDVDKWLAKQRGGGEAA